MNFDRKYKRNLIAGSAVSLFILLISSVASWISIDQLLDSQRWVDHTNEVILRLETIMSRTKDAETGQRGYLLTGEDQFLEPYQGAKEDVWEAFNAVSRLTVDNPAQQGDLKELSRLIESRFNLLESSVNRKRQGLPMNMQNFERGRTYMDELRARINVMEKRERDLLVQRTDKFDRYSVYTPILIIFASLIAVVVTVVFFFRLRADYNQRLKMQAELVEKEKFIAHRVDEVQQFAEEVAGGNYKIRLDAEKK